jgi:hypothetical protein
VNMTALPVIDTCVRRVIGKARPAAQLRPFLSPGDDVHIVQVANFGREFVQSDITFRAIEAEVDHTDAADEMVAVLRTARALSEVSATRGVTRDVRLTFTWRHKRELCAAVETMLGCNPERIIFAHGRWHQSNRREELQRAFAWLLKD